MLIPIVPTRMHFTSRIMICDGDAVPHAQTSQRIVLTKSVWVRAENTARKTCWQCIQGGIP
eukprot:5012552-Amphidinium_carterae.1